MLLADNKALDRYSNYLMNAQVGEKVAMAWECEVLTALFAMQSNEGREMLKQGRVV